MSSLFDLTGKTAVVTGGNRGLGKEIALGLAEAGANIVVIARKIDEQVISDIEKHGVKAMKLEFDLLNFDQYSSILDQILLETEKVDILVNNAGVQKRYDSVEFPKEDWDFVIDINANATFFLCQLFGKHMLESGYGKIINMASLLSFQGGLRVPAYAASKGAVIQFTKALANEWAHRGVNVNAIAPGYIDTEMNTALLADETRNRQILERIPAGRWGKPEDMHGAAVFLASAASDYLHGTTIPVDGGWLGR
ncbi:2-deoxy-D-gluconate 3-dehydrogenase [Planococcus sp. PAMC 21323]|uniref:2-dehydro-3-deoxy-D-gluconate 5-dehydrogenase KduD n=1 Tax=Planococcus sp. PAMC 21323 TaxID=1526927 RepID=UPI00056E6DF1|nr:2-dehydro-3-deoxy-D-gluconate 5-dehydrogenase KduD [Planococcus sp. PAMC 21323]AIY06666.1 2-deoxy-D-gluconate 3-dehydrogenase [Planococcus sp. PAMC 21323]